MVNGHQFEKYLENNIEGDVFFDENTRHIYSVDASIFEVVPKVIVHPKHLEDIVKTINASRTSGIPITARGAATGITGGCLGEGIILDTSKYMNKILEIDFEQEYAVCEPGVVQDQLNQALESKGYRLGPDTSTGNRATLGGMVSNNSAGARSLLYGKMVDHVEAIELVLSNGEIIRCENKNPEQLEQLALLKSREGEIYRALLGIRNKYRHEIETQFPKIPRHVSGYNLDELLKGDSINLCKLICGSEGTLGIITKIRVKICKRPLFSGLCLLFFDNLNDSFKEVPKLLEYNPSAIEMIDHHIIEMGRNSPSVKNKLDWLKETPQAIFAVELSDSNQELLKSRLENFIHDMKAAKIGDRQHLLLEKLEMQNFWSIRKSGLGLLLSKRSYSRAYAFIEDVSVAPERLGAFMQSFQKCLQAHGMDAGIYGHVGSGCMHIRPYLDLRDAPEIEKMKTVMVEVTELLKEYKGALSGEHGDGYIRSWLNEKLFGKTIYNAFVELKQAFDPYGLMNPHKITDGLPIKDNLRISPETSQIKIETFLDFSPEGGFELAVDLCNGNGSCRKSEGLMCPSFQATGDEYQTTRARAQTLRSIINGKLRPEAFTGQGLHDVLDLCLECKGCKTECPSEVDMAKMKSEFLYHYHKKHGFTIRDRLFAYIAIINTYASKFSELFNLISQSKISQYMLMKIGITNQRPFPKLARHTFSKIFKKRDKSNHTKKVILYNDTYTEFYTPSIGIATCDILNKLGYEVEIPQKTCCGRPFISKGLLEEAREQALRIIDNLYPYALQGLPIIILEPSCLSAIKDDYKGLLGNLGDEINERTKKVATAVTSLDDFLYEEICVRNNKPPVAQIFFSRIAYHSHCHQKALYDTGKTKKIFEALTHIPVEEIPSGCCGLAGSFGYETDHYDISMKIGSLKLFPYIENCDDSILIIANGTSCRNQIEHGTHKRALHLAEALSLIFTTK